MNELKEQNRSVVRLSFLLAAVGSAAAAYFGWRAFVGVWAGMFMCLAGYFMIVRFCRTAISFRKGPGFASYVLRYILYGLFLFGCVWLGLPIFSLFAGILLQKAALVLVPLFRKEGSNVSNQFD